MPTLTAITSPDQARDLVSLEYDFVSIDGSLGDLAERLRSAPIVGGTAAARNVAALRDGLREVLARVDGPITALVRAFEERFGVDAVARHEADDYADSDDVPF